MLTLPDWNTPETRILKTRLLKKTPKLAIQQSNQAKHGMVAKVPTAATPHSTKEGSASAPVQAGKQSGKHKQQANSETPASMNAELAASTPRKLAQENTASSLHPTIKEAVASAKATSAPKPADNHRFPNQGLAIYRQKGWSADARQTWAITSSGYKVTMRMALFGKSINYESTGKITPDGIAPDSFIDTRNDDPQPKHIATFDRSKNELRFGDPNEPQTIPLPANAQDILSMGYQLAVLLDAGKTVDLTLVTGKRIYKIRFTAENEEEIEIPVGTIRAAHVKGKELDGTREFDIWLDLDHQNFPVRLKGVDNTGKTLDLALVGLTFNDKQVYRYQDYQYSGSKK
ncbi:DUF3108 domain-containing protein [Leeia oryzae]|uniref:DUF3108 domain-containing protein n=1 Tax=Leeia oryzae TaxID=356662 RepID=UPI0003A52932|nr:DUF3108 domain-containing protein [Leeia oryzae]